MPPSRAGDLLQDAPLPGRRLPHNIEAEMALLGAILVKPRAYERVADFLRPEHFALGEHQRIFSGIRLLAEQGRLADAVTMKSHLDGAGALNAVGGVAYLNRLIDCAVTPSNAGEYGRLIHDLHVRRELIAIGDHIVERAYRDDLESGAQADVALDAIRQVSCGLGVIGDLDPEPLEDLLREDIEPRGWLLGTVLCRRFLTVLAAAGGTGKSALAITMALSLATGRRLAGAHVHKRCKVLVLTLEDGREEYKRRFKAACLYHGVSMEDLGGRVEVRSLTSSYSSGHTLVAVDERGEIIQTGMAEKIAKIVRDRKIDVCIFDPFVALSGAPENDNTSVDRVAKILTGLAEDLNVAIMVAHHFAKGGDASPGDASKVRGASALVDASRFACTLTSMSAEDATYYGISDEDRRSYVRMDDAKANLVAKRAAAQWFRIRGIMIGNATDAYPKGDNVHTIEAWEPPETWNGVPVSTLNAILTDIDRGAPGGERFSAARNAGAHPAWRVVKKHLPEKPDAQCKEIVSTWVGTGLLIVDDYVSPSSRKTRPGLYVDHAKRPGR